MMDLDSFSGSYAEAREKFLQACELRGLAVQSHVHPLRGRQGEELAIDVARLGAADARHLLIVSSGCHGIEGYCGSGLQVDLLRDASWQARCERAGLAVLYLHALNPHGFSWERRVTHENVDLNRNFRDFAAPLPANPDYLALAPLLLPRRCPPTLGSQLGLMLQLARKGRRHVQAAISRGQHEDARGLFFAGHAPSWSHLRLLDILAAHGRQCRRMAWIDVHTGLGPPGVGERIYKGAPGPEAIARARSWWGPQVTSTAEGNSSSALLGGTLDIGVMRACPQAEYNGLTLEYGTLPGRQVLDALRADHWLHRNPGADEATAARVRRRLRAAFYVETAAWKQAVLTQGREVVGQALAGLATPLD